jgi:hypothetical protein
MAPIVYEAGLNGHFFEQARINPGDPDYLVRGKNDENGYLLRCNSKDECSVIPLGFKTLRQFRLENRVDPSAMEVNIPKGQTYEGKVDNSPGSGVSVRFRHE